ncbi:MAG TPA: chemotaxis protein CheW [Nannocystaceae bacterium]|nr:chemotaxis protein CheW [Nannocystaceae bacterium]
MLCRVRNLLVALPLEHVAETMRPLPVEPLAAMPEFVVGLAIVRGEPTPVVDAGVLLASRDPAAWTRFVAIRSGTRRVALAVEAVLGVRSFDGDTVQTLPPLLGAASADLVASVGALDRELLVVLDAARVIPESSWQSIDATRSS